MTLVIVLGVLLIHFVSFGIFIALSARASEGDEDGAEMESVPNGNVVSIAGFRASKLAPQSVFATSGHVSTRRG